MFCRCCKKSIQVDGHEWGMQGRYHLLNTGEAMFEGSEKKLEIFFQPHIKLLKQYPAAFWRQVCKKAGIRILSAFSNSFCDSYILSESSLFVWENRLLMLTCGHTSLADSLMYMLKYFKREDMDLLFFQRKNEFFPRRQKTSFMDDLGLIIKKIKGRAFCFGNPDEHHFYLFHSGSPYPSIKGDQTMEILMYDLDDCVKDIFLNSRSATELRKELGLDKIFLNTPVDDYLFKPCGYSLNGMSAGDSYYTIHVTPQNPGFYASFETNIKQKSPEEIIKQVLAIFKPVAMDVVFFSAQAVEDIKVPDTFIRSSFFGRKLECGYQVQFSSFFRPCQYPRPPFLLTHPQHGMKDI